MSSRNWSSGRWARSPATASARTPRSSAPSGSIGAFTSRQVSSSPRLPPSLAKVPLDDGESTTDRLERLDGEPALVRPLARRDAVPRAERGIEVAGVVDAEVAEPRADPRLVDDPVAAMSLGELDVRLERGLDDVRVRVRPGHADEHADVAALDEPEAAGAAGDLRELPRQQVPPLDSPSNFVVSAKRSVSHGRLTPWPSTSVATQTSAAPARKRSISSRRDASGIAP